MRAIRTALMLIGLVALMIFSEYIAPAQAAEYPIYQKPLRYYITQAERKEIERTVMAEAGGESFEGQLAVAWCILNAAELEGARPTQVLIDYGYTPTRKRPTVSVRDAVASAFDRGEEITREPILFFYAPARCVSRWHESQTYCLTVGAHKFFTLKEENPE